MPIPSLLLAVLLAAAPAWAIAPNVLVYQGQLQESGAPVTGSRDVTISLCPSPSVALTSCASTGRQTVAVANGLLRASYSAPAGIDLSTGAWWLDLQVGPVGGSLQEQQPREALTSGAFALYASTAGALVAPAGSAGVVIAASVAVGTAPPTAMLDVQGSAKVRGNTQLGVSSSTCAGAPPGTMTWTGASLQLCQASSSGTAFGFATGFVSTATDALDFELAAPGGTGAAPSAGCRVYWCDSGMVTQNQNHCCCPSGTVMIHGGSSGYYYSQPTGAPVKSGTGYSFPSAACTGSFNYSTVKFLLSNTNTAWILSTRSTMTYSGNGLIGWQAFEPLPPNQGIALEVRLICCPQ